MKTLNITTSVLRENVGEHHFLAYELSSDGGLQKDEAWWLIAGYEWEGCLSKAFFFSFSANLNCLNN